MINYKLDYQIELLDGGGSACMMKYEMYDLMC